MVSISVIVPVYYGEKYIDGIIRQVETSKKYLKIDNYVEVLFVNDAPDAPLTKIKEAKSIHPTFINTDRNVGIHAARLKGLMRACGEYVLFLDQDDIIRPEYFCSQLQTIGKGDAVVCQAIHGNKKLYSGNGIFEKRITKKYILGKGNPIISPGQVLLKRNAIPDLWVDNILKHNGADDLFLWICMISENCTFSLNYNILYEHVLQGENASDDIEKMIRSEQEIIRIVQRRKILTGEDFELLMEGYFDRNNIKAHELCSLRKKFAVLDKWMLLKENNVKLADYLYRVGMESIAIYGCGILGEHIYSELKDNMEIECFIDRNAGEMQKEIPVYSMTDMLPDVDGIIVTLIDDAEKVSKEIEESFHKKVIVLKDWIMGLELKSGKV